MRFGTAVSCMDGRIQDPVAAYLRSRFAADHIDVVSEAGPVRCCAAPHGSEELDSILRRVEISVAAHGSRQLALVAHHDCAGNPEPPGRQLAQLERGVRRLRERFPALEVIGVWVDAGGSAREMVGAAGHEED